MANLCQAIQTGDAESVEKTLSKHPDLLCHPQSLNFEITPLLEAVIRDDEEVIRLLIKFGADVNRGNPLRRALIQASTRSAELMLTNGAKLVGPQWNGSFALEYIYWIENSKTRREMLQLVLPYELDDPDFEKRRGRNVLENLIFKRDYRDKLDDHQVLEVVEVLLTVKSISIDEINDQKWLISSVFSGNVPLVSFLIGKGADVMIRTWVFSLSALHISAHHDHPEMVKLLLENGADVNDSCNEYKATPLHDACVENNEDAIALLICKGADVNAEDMSGMTPLSLLSRTRSNYERCVIAFFREFSRLALDGCTMSKYNADFIGANPKCREHYEKCTSELELMGRTKFYGKYSYQSVLKMSAKKLALLAKNEEFVRKFEENIGDFPYYEDDLRDIFEKAKRLRDESMMVDYSVNYIFGEVFPSVVLKKLAKCLTLDDLPM